MTATTSSFPNTRYSTPLVAANVDELVVQGIRHIRDAGIRITPDAGACLQAYGVDFVLTHSHERVHSLRAPRSVRYLCRELRAYFRGSLLVDEGLAQASSFWRTLADADGKINSNYGHYVFRQAVPTDVHGCLTQYDWIIHCLRSNPDSRRAIINVNQPWHKTATKDFPCTVSMVYFVRATPDGQRYLCSEVASRSTDIITGLPYDMGWFSFLTELVWQHLRSDVIADLHLGYTCMRSTFTQLYDATAHLADEIIDNYAMRDCNTIAMPYITDSSATISDIISGLCTTPVSEWIYENSMI